MKKSDLTVAQQNGAAAAVGGGLDSDIVSDKVGKIVVYTFTLQAFLCLVYPSLFIIFNFGSLS